MGKLAGPIERLEIERDELARQYAELKRQLKSEDYPDGSARAESPHLHTRRSRFPAR
jgi:hypothetical protein